jgi:hypothetical protein
MGVKLPTPIGSQTGSHTGEPEKGTRKMKTKWRLRKFKRQLKKAEGRIEDLRIDIEVLKLRLKQAGVPLLQVHLDDTERAETEARGRLQ